MEKIMVTGGLGYIGSHTIYELGFKYNVNVMDLKNGWDCSQIADVVTGFRFMKSNTVIHFAAFKDVNESIQNPLKYYDNNIRSLVNVLDQCQDLGIKKLIFSSSCAVYGDIPEMPVYEDGCLGKVKSPYAYTKIVCEKILQDYCKANPDFTAIALRYFNPSGCLIGDHQPSGLISLIHDAAINDKVLPIYGDDYPTRDGTCIRDYVHVADIADAHVKALDFNEKGFHVFNLGSGEGVSVLEAINAYVRVTGRAVKSKVEGRRAGDIEAIYADCTKAKKILGWTAKRSLDDIMASYSI